MAEMNLFVFTWLLLVKYFCAPIKFYVPNASIRALLYCTMISVY